MFLKKSWGKGGDPAPRASLDPLVLSDCAQQNLKGIPLFSGCDLTKQKWQQQKWTLIYCISVSLCTKTANFHQINRISWFIHKMSRPPDPKLTLHTEETWLLWDLYPKTNYVPKDKLLLVVVVVVGQWQMNFLLNILGELFCLLSFFTEEVQAKLSSS